MFLHQIWTRAFPARRWVCPLCAALFLAMSPTWAGEPATALTLEAATRKALAQAPLLDARMASQHAAREEADRAGALPDPQLSVGIENLATQGPGAFTAGGDSMTMRTVGITQALPSRAKRLAQRDLAGAHVEQAATTITMTQLAIEQQVAAAWITAWGAHHEAQMLQAMRSEWSVDVVVAEARLRGGTGSAADVLATRMEALDLENRIDDAASREAQANRTIPYRVWRWWHKLSGPLFLVVVLHWLSIESPIALASPAGLWLALTATAGTAGALYKLLLYRHLAGQAEYRVVATTPGKAAIHLELAPVGKRLAFQPGQFGFLRLKAHGLREPHPFTLASGTHPDGHVDFVIRALGDYTSQLVKTIRVGMLADIHAPHGRFTRNRKARREVWIGGGVGISPFIAWLRDEEAGSCEQVTLFYFHTPGRAFPDVQALEDLAIARGAELVPVPDGPDSPAFRQRFAAIVREIDPQAVDVAFCGPVGLLDEVRARMRHEGVPMANLRHEHFNFR